MDKEIKKLDPRMKKFVEDALELIHLNRFYDEFKNRNGIMDGYHFHVHLVKWFLNLKIELDRERYNEYSNVHFVKDLSEKDIKECLFYLNYILGNSSHTGGHDYVKIYDSIQRLSSTYR